MDENNNWPVNQSYPQPEPENPTPVESNKKQNYIIGIATMLIGFTALVGGYFLFVGSSGESNQASSETTASEESTQDAVSENKKQNENKKVSYPPNANPQDLELTENDKVRSGIMSVIGIREAAVSIKLGRLARNAEEVSLLNDPELYEKDDLLIDPATDELYVFVDSPPRRGEIQYLPDYRCTDNYRGVEKPDSPPGRWWAMLMLLDDGSYICQFGLRVGGNNTN